MTLPDDVHAALAVLDARLNTMLPEEYQGAYDDVEPVPMGSAGLIFGPDGRVAWNEMWASFCDLAMAGGPPHKGTLLEPATPAAIDAEPGRHAVVVEEACRGVRMVTGLQVVPSPVPGWIRMRCAGDAMAGWLLRAITMENVAVRGEGGMLDLPVAPAYRLEKEIKNVVTVIAKTCHYWAGHMPASQQRRVGRLFVTMAASSRLVAPADAGDEISDDRLRTDAAAGAEAIANATGLRAAGHRYAGWLGLQAPSVRAAIWMMRALVVSNVLARREGTVLFVPVHPVRDPGGLRVARALARVHALASARGVF